jgi:hypothetical protein
VFLKLMEKLDLDMADSKDIILAIIGFALSFYGSVVNNLLTVVGGILILILMVCFKIQEIEEDIKILKAQVNTQVELKRIWKKIDEMKNERKKR